MKSTPTNPPPDKRTKAVKAKPMYARYVDNEWVNLTDDAQGYIGGHIFVNMQPVAVLPCASAKAAKLLTKIANDPEAAAKAISKKMWHHSLDAKEGQYTIMTVFRHAGLAPAKPEDK